jgi:hypothetical protein
MFLLKVCDLGRMTEGNCWTDGGKLIYAVKVLNLRGRLWDVFLFCFCLFV